ncbi:MFS transporter [Nocardia sp. NPDC003963]
MIDDPVDTPTHGPARAPSAPVPAAADEPPVPDRRMARALALVLVASVIGLFPFTIYSTFLVPIAAAARAPESGIGFLRGLGGLAALVAGIALAPLLARWSKNYVTVAALVLLAAASALATAGTVAALTVFCLGIGVATALLTPALLALATSRFAGPGNIGRAATMVTATQSLAAVCAGPIIGVIGSWHGWHGALWTTAALSVIIAAGFLPVRARAAAPPAHTTAPLGYIASFRALRARPGLLGLLAVAGLRTASFMGYLAFLAVFYADRFGLTAAGFTLVWTLSGASFFLGNYLTGRWVRDPGSVMGRHPGTVLSAGLSGALIAVLGVFHTTALPPALAATALMGFGHAVVAAQVTTSIARRGGDLAAAVFSLNAAGMSLGVFGGSLLGGVGLALAGHTGLALALSLPTILALVLVPATGTRRRPDESGHSAPAAPPG